MNEEEFKITLDFYFKDYQGDVAELLQKTVVKRTLNSKAKILHLINFKDEEMRKEIEEINVLADSRTE